MAPVTQYVFAEMLGISEHFTAGSHEWLPYSVIPTFPKQTDKHQFIALLTKADCQILLYFLFMFSCTRAMISDWDVSLGRMVTTGRHWGARAASFFL